MTVMEGEGTVIDRAEQQVDATVARSFVPAQFDDDRVVPRQYRLPTVPHCPEIQCVRHLLPAGALAFAELRAAEIKVGADRVLIAHDYIDEETYLIELGRELGIPFELLDDTSRDVCRLDDTCLIEANHTGMLPLAVGHDEITIVVAPRELTMRFLCQAYVAGSDIASRIRLTTNARLSRFVMRHAARAIKYRAAETLRVERPELSAGSKRGLPLPTAFAVAAIVSLGILSPSNTTYAIDIVVCAIFLAWTVLRLIGIVSPQQTIRSPTPTRESELPVYTIVAALLREAEAVKDLVSSLSSLNYPKERLDIKLVLEPDDAETRNAIAAMKLSAPFDVIVAPDGAPRTKPKALNAALPFARGDFIVIYDAEDRPEPDQLRLALDSFAENDEQLACVQARLTIDNTSDSWLTRLFTAEYAGLFDVFLPGLSAWHLPLPLGGSSNHFRIDILRKVGAWDPYNVTEDADLGMRLARAGYRTSVIQSTTYEEAPVNFRPWLNQRTRWFKGWMQTWLVHMRSPRKLTTDLGWRGCIAFQLLVGGTVLAALVHPIFLATLLYELTIAVVADTTLMTAIMNPHTAFLFGGYAASIVLGFVGLRRRRLLGCAWCLGLVPVYWIILSIAAWRALYQLLQDPYRWEKTSHGLARSSRLARHSTNS